MTNYDDLVWGEGETRLEIFLEPTCPFSGRAFNKLKPLLDHVGHDKLTVKIWMQSQPWHAFSSIACRTVLAASGLSDGKSSAWNVLQTYFDNRETFVLEEHRRGPNLDMSPSDMIAKIEQLCGLDLRAAFEEKEATDLVKAHARYSRKHSIHGSPTFMVNGAVNDDMSSGDEIETWAKTMGLS